MKEKVLSVFIDESGDFGQYNPASPNYYVARILHNQEIDISKDIEALERHVSNWGYPKHTIHTGPLIRRESVYYDYGQVELAQILVSVFNIMFSNVEFRKIETNQYKLSQAADLICTVEAISQKNVLTKSESEFFHSKNDFKKNIYKNIAKKNCKIEVSLKSKLA